MSSFQTKVHPHFVVDLEEAINYYRGQSKVACAKFRSEIKRQLNQIKANPYTRSVRYDDIRFARIEKFPYTIHYSIDIFGNTVLVHSLICDHQDPDSNWHKRF